MKYTLNEKIDIDKIKEEVTKKGFSDRAKKYINSVLLAAQITGVSPALADDFNTVQSNSQSNKIELKDDKITVESIKEEFKKYINNSSLSKEQKRKMLRNLQYSLKLIEIRDIDANGINGYYSPLNEKIVLDDNFVDLDTKIHEMMHAASTILPRKVNGIYSFMRMNAQIGRGFNEGITEYLANKVISENGIFPKDIAYPEIVRVTKDIIALYGEKNLIDAYLDSPGNLIKLMKRDGIEYTYFLEKVDSYYKEVYNHPKLSISNAFRQDEAREKYEKIGKLIERAKLNRLKENSKINLPESEWKKTYTKIEKIEFKHIIDDQGFLQVMQDLNSLYGKGIVKDTIFNGKSNLYDSMLNDGHDANKLIKLINEYHLLLYNKKGNDFKESAKLKYKEIGVIIEDIRDKKSKKNYAVNFPESKTKAFYINNLGGTESELKQLKSNENSLESIWQQNFDKSISVEENVDFSKINLKKITFNNLEEKESLNKSNKIVEWFKKLKEKIKGRFKKSDEILLLNSGNEKIESNDSKQNEFLDNIKVEESELVGDQLTKDEEKMQKEVNVNSDNTEMER